MTTFQKDKGIMSLAVVLVVGLFGLGTAITVATVALVGLNKNFDNKSGNQSFYTAEAAAEEGTYRYIDKYINGQVYNGETFDFPELLNNIQTAQISVINPIWPDVNAIVTAIATNNINQREIVYTLNIYPAGGAFDKALYSGDIINMQNANDSFKGVIGDIYASNEIMCDKNAPFDFGDDCDGTLSSPDLDNIDIKCIDPDCVSTNPPQIENVPTPILDPADLMIKPGVTTFDNLTDLDDYLTNSCDNPDDIIFFNNTSPIIIPVSCCLKVGALITEGDLDITNSGAGIEGLVYVKGVTTIEKGGNCEDDDGNKIKIRGSLVSVGGIIVNKGVGASFAIYDENLSSIWKEFVEPPTPGSSIPVIVKWGEK